MIRLHRRRYFALACLLLICCSWPAAAQDEDEEVSSTPLIKRFSFGARGSALFTSLMDTRTVTESSATTDPPLSTTTYSNSASKRYGVGPSVQYRVTDRFDINVDFLYRRTGYDAGVEVKTQVTDKDKAEFVSAEFERTRADYWDIPILGRYYNKGPDEGGSRAFVTGGIVLRNVTAIRTFSEKLTESGLSDTNTTAAQPAHKNVQGGVLGVGIRFRDGVGLKVEFEVRATRWLKRTFEAGRTSSNLNQAEAMVGLTF